MKNALGWLRSTDKKEFNIDGVSVASRKLSETDEERRVKKTANALSWLRINDVTKEYDAPSVVSFGSMGSGFVSIGPASQGDIAAIYWLRTNRAAHMPDDESEAPSQVADKPLTEEEQRAIVMSSAMDWLKGALLPELLLMVHLWKSKA
jgi:hypothetical protein